MPAPLVTLSVAEGSHYALGRCFDFAALRSTWQRGRQVVKTCTACHPERSRRVSLCVREMFRLRCATLNMTERAGWDGIIYVAEREGFTSRSAKASLRGARKPRFAGREGYASRLAT